MKKFILIIFVLCTFAFGFRGSCVFEPVLTDEQKNALASGLRYNGGDGFIDLYYIVAGAGGKIYRTTNPLSGSWASVSIGTTNKINYIKISSRTDTSITFGVGDNGTVIRSLNEGLNWTVLNSNVIENLKSIDFVGSDPDQLVAVGENGRIIKSTNCGETWSVINSGLTKNLNSVYSSNFFTTYIAGDDGTLLRSSNGGINWINQSFPDSGTDLNKVGFLGTWFFGNILAIVGDNGSMYRSFNSLSWDSVYTGVNADLYDFKFKNASSGYVCGDNGTVAYTTNSGTEWFTDFFLQSITDSCIKSTLILNDTTVVGVAGNNIYVLYANESLLPVELTSFNSSVNRNDVTLSWTTSSEVNNSGFYIERSTGQNEWSNTGFVKGNGTYTEPFNFHFTDKNLNSGKYHYRLKQTDFNGNFEYYYLNNEVNVAIPAKFTLMQNYPNPFNPATKIAFDLPYESEIRLSVYDISGKEINVLMDQKMSAGYYTIEWNASGFSSGTYFYRLMSERGGIKESEVKKMILIR